MGDRAPGRERELTAYLVVGDLDAARRIAARSVVDSDLVDLMLREPARPHGRDPARAAALPPREVAFWWWLRGLPAHDRMALVLATRHGWAYDDDLAALLGQASAVLGRPAREAPAAVTAALDRRLGALPPTTAATMSPRIDVRRGPRLAAGLAAAVLLLAAAATALAGAQPRPVPAEPALAQLLPRPLARPIANYEDLAVVPGRQWDLPERSGQRSAPPWMR